MKRLFDVTISTLGLLVVGPLLVVVMFLVWRHDWKSPLYISSRVGIAGKEFRMVKLRSMIIGADGTGVDSTGANDIRITPIGHFIRRYKLDEVSQLWNVMTGDMSLVGPRPNVKRETDLYSSVEKRLLSVRPGITDLSSIVFSDEGEILEERDDPDLTYNQLIRPWKSRLGLVYVEHQSLLLDVQLIVATVVSVLSRRKALGWLVGKLGILGVEPALIEVCKRESELEPFPPPGLDEVVTYR